MKYLGGLLFCSGSSQAEDDDESSLLSQELASFRMIADVYSVSA
jgi:hypothetical protein